jgi:hypothetical protein
MPGTLVVRAVRYKEKMARFDEKLHCTVKSGKAHFSAECKYTRIIQMTVGWAA